MMKKTLIALIPFILLGQLQAADNLLQLEQALQSERKHSRYWQYGWTSFFIVDMGVKALIVSTSDQEDKKYDAKVEFVKSTIATIAMFTRPMNIHNLDDELKKDLSEAERQQILIRAIEREQRERSWKAHAGSVALNLAGSLFIWLDDDRGDDALLKFVLGMIVGELKIFSSPTKTWKSFQKMEDKSFLQQVSVRPLLNGLAFTYSF
jgi:hypothetical protein